MKRVDQYLSRWMACGYPEGIPDEVPDALMRANLAPSWKAIALAILKNDTAFSSLGFPAPTSEWYGALKRIELEARNGGSGQTMRLF